MENQGQTAIEYLLLLAVVVAIVLVGFKTYLPQSHNAVDLYYNRAAVGIMGKPPLNYYP
jgi:Flp pilus assembly pilin Flp